MVRGNVPAGLRTLRQAFHGQDRRLRATGYWNLTKQEWEVKESARTIPLAGLLAHSAGRTVRVSGRWSGSGSLVGRRSGQVVMGCGVLGQGHGLSSEGLGNGLG
ncbi:hypothetical protein DY000_02053536 [Brassica cretica]|uniref:Uncharacterized protein n=1 Tax=Brassica cretica TaxID=69181 RepID=A0ABQ7AEQ7_BRACR|nr:hypothetical protein DY000_02053536 [Brassica cretica]